MGGSKSQAGTSLYFHINFREFQLINIFWQIFLGMTHMTWLY